MLDVGSPCLGVPVKVGICGVFVMVVVMVVLIMFIDITHNSASESILHL